MRLAGSSIVNYADMTVNWLYTREPSTGISGSDINIGWDGTYLFIAHFKFGNIGTIDIATIYNHSKYWIGFANDWREIWNRGGQNHLYSYTITPSILYQSDQFEPLVAVRKNSKLLLCWYMNWDTFAGAYGHGLTSKRNAFTRTDGLFPSVVVIVDEPHI